MLSKSSRLSILLSILAVLIVILAIKHHPHRPTSQANITQKQLYELDPSLADIVANRRIDANTVLLQVRAGKPTLYRCCDKNDSHRLKILWEFVQQVAEHYTMPDGDYLVSFRDAFRRGISYPVLAFATTKDLAAEDKIILIPDTDAMSGYTKFFEELDRTAKLFPWDKKEPKVFWRGAAAGKKLKERKNRKFYRKTLVDLSKSTGFVDAAFTNYDHIQEDMPWFAESYNLVPKISPADSQVYRYLISVDGNSCASSRTAWILYSNSALFKHDSSDVQWYYHELQPWVHYIPVAKNFSDLEQNFLWAEQHPIEAQKMAANGHELAKEIFTKEQIMLDFIAALHKSNHAARQTCLEN